MSDPYSGRFATAGNPYIAADGTNIHTVGADQVQYYVTLYGDQDAGLVWAEDRNRVLLNSGAALQTSQGVVSLDAVKAQLQSNGYVGSTDIQSLSNAFNMLHTPKPSSVPTPAAGGGINLGGGFGSIPTPVLLGGGVLLLVLLGGRGRL